MRGHRWLLVSLLISAGLARTARAQMVISGNLTVDVGSNNEWFSGTTVNTGSTPRTVFGTLIIQAPVCGNGTVEQGSEQCESGACCQSCRIAPGGTVCRAAAGTCDVAETCDGATNACPANAF